MKHVTDYIIRYNCKNTFEIIEKQSYFSENVPSFLLFDAIGPLYCHDQGIPSMFPETKAQCKYIAHTMCS